MKALEWSQHFSHFKSMGIFPDNQGQLTPQSEVWSGWISNLSKTLWLSLLSARVKKIQSKVKALEWSHYSSIFQTLKGSLLRSLWWNVAEIQTYPSFYYCHCDLQHWRRSIQKWRHYSGHNISLIIRLWGFFFKRSRAANSSVPGQILPKLKPIRVFMVVLVISAIIKKNQPKMKKLKWSQDFPHYYHMVSICWKPEFWSDLAQNILQTIPHPNDAPDEIW